MENITKQIIFLGIMSIFTTGLALYLKCEIDKFNQR